MEAKPTVAIVGAGNLGTALALSLIDARYKIEAIITRREGKSLARARRLARATGARLVNGAQGLRVDVLWLCVPDGAIAKAAESLAEAFDGRVALHSSGVLTSDELEPFRQAGASVASAHPLMTFVKGSRPSLAEVSFAIEGDKGAVRLVRRLVRDLGGTPYLIGKDEKNAYHAWGTFASPLLTTLLATTEQVAALAGVKATAARRRMLPILRQTVENYAMLGAPAGFSGPIIRGDVETIRRHLEVLQRARFPRTVYLALAAAAVEYLPARNPASLRRLLAAVSRTSSK